MLLVENLTFRYPEGGLALADVSLRVEDGECVAVIGPNGAGKSTFLLHLNGLLRGAGRIVVDGLELTNATVGEIRRRVGLVFQDPDDQLFLPTCLEDVMFGPLNEGATWEEASQRAMEALGAVGMADAAELPPHQLSVGQKKRVALATILAMKPTLLAFDEPSAGLDPAARRQFLNLVRGLPQTRLLASHDLDLVEQLCPRTLLLDDGRVIADGPTEKLLSDTGLLLAHRLEPPGYRPAAVPDASATTRDGRIAGASDALASTPP